MREHYPSVDADGVVTLEGGAPSTQTVALPAGWEACLDPVCNRVFYFHAPTQKSQWHSPLGGRSTRVVRPPREPYAQTFDDEEPDLLMLSYPRMIDDSKPDLADHRMASPLATVLQAPAPQGVEKSPLLKGSLLS